MYGCDQPLFLLRLLRAITHLRFNCGNSISFIRLFRNFTAFNNLQLQTHIANYKVYQITIHFELLKYRYLVAKL